jgi:sulfur carrier protein ThiS
VLTESGDLARGYVLVVNDDIVRRDHGAVRLERGDQVSIIAAIAGG